MNLEALQIFVYNQTGILIKYEQLTPAKYNQIS